MSSMKAKNLWRLEQQFNEFFMVKLISYLKPHYIRS